MPPLKASSLADTGSAFSAVIVPELLYPYHPIVIISLVHPWLRNYRQGHAGGYSTKSTLPPSHSSHYVCHLQPFQCRETLEHHLRQGDEVVVIRPPCVCRGKCVQRGRDGPMARSQNMQPKGSASIPTCSDQKTCSFIAAKHPEYIGITVLLKGLNGACQVCWTTPVTANRTTTQGPTSKHRPRRRHYILSSFRNTFSHSHLEGISIFSVI